MTTFCCPWKFSGICL